MGHLCEGSGFVRIDRVFPLLIESGLIYFSIWVCSTSTSVLTEVFTTLSQLLYWISLFGLVLNPGFTTMAFFSVSAARAFLPHILSSTEYRLDKGFISDTHSNPH
jgi:hypothetical protein